MTRHDRIHLARLVLLLEEPSDDAPLSHLNLLRLNTTAKHARHLLDELFREDGGEGNSYASTSRARPPKGSLVDLDERLTKAERRLAALADRVQPSLTSEQADLFALFPLPAPVAPPLPSTFSPAEPSHASSTSTDTPASTLRNGSAFASALSHDRIPSAASSERSAATDERPFSPQPPGNKVDDSPDSFPPSATLRQRPTAVPPYLAARRAREEKARLEAASSSSATSTAPNSKGKGKETASTAANDLLPASSSTASTDLLSHHHSLQSSLLSSLTDLSGALKTSTLTFSENLAKDKEVLEKAQGKLEGNSVSMEKNQGRLKEVRGKTRGTTCWTIGAVVVVCVMWILMFGLMRVAYPVHVD